MNNKRTVYIVLAVPAGRGTYDMMLTFRCTSRSYQGLSDMELIEQRLSHQQARNLVSWMELADVHRVVLQASAIEPHTKTRTELWRYFRGFASGALRVKHVAIK